VPCALSLVIAGRIAGRCVAGFGARAAVSAGLAIAAGGMLLLSRLGPDTAYSAGLLPGIVLVPAGAGLAFAGAAVLVAAGVPAREAGLAGGVMSTAMELGPTVGLALLVTIATAWASHATAGGASPRAAATTGYAGAFGAACLAFALLALLTVITGHPHHHNTKESP
jgi:hypothetical protein